VKTPAASIIITNFNYARYVGAAVDSALAQSVDVEVIVVDNGSTDDSLEVLRRYEPTIRILERPNGGQGAATNTGFEKATAPIVVFLDADDLVEPDLVERLVEAFGRAGVARVHFPLRVIDRNGDRTGDMLPPHGTQLSSGDLRDALGRFPDDLTWQPMSGNAFAADVLRRILPMPTKGYEKSADYYLLNLSTAHGEVLALDRPGGSYRLHSRNSYRTTAWTLHGIRLVLVRTELTHRLLVEQLAAVDPARAPASVDQLRSVTVAAHAMIFIRLDPEHHRYPGDSRWNVAVPWDARRRRPDRRVVAPPARDVGLVRSHGGRSASVGAEGGGRVHSAEVRADDMTSLTADAAIVNFNARASLRECLESVRVVEGIDTILVADNGSTDGSLDMVRSEFPDVIAVSLPHNPGFGAAVNELALGSSAEALLVLNADVRVSPAAAAQMLERLDAHPTTAIVGPMVVDRAGTPQRTWYRDHSIAQLLWWETGLWHLRRGHYSDELTELADGGPFTAPWVTARRSSPAGPSSTPSGASIRTSSSTSKSSTCAGGSGPPGGRSRSSRRPRSSTTRASARASSRCARCGRGTAA